MSEDSAVAFKKEKPDQRQDCRALHQTGAGDAVSIYTYAHTHTVVHDQYATMDLKACMLIQICKSKGLNAERCD